VGTLNHTRSVGWTAAHAAAEPLRRVRRPRGDRRNGHLAPVPAAAERVDGISVAVSRRHVQSRPPYVDARSG